jgi:hypothetical protein
MTVIYSLLSRTLKCLSPQIELLRRHFLGQSRIVIVQGPGPTRVPDNMAAQLGVEPLTLTRTQVPAHPVMTVSVSYQILNALFGTIIPSQQEQTALIVHGDLMPTKAFSIEQLLDGCGLAARGSREVGLIAWTFLAIDKAKIDFSTLTSDGLATRIDGTRIWEATDLFENEMQPYLGVKTLPGYTSDVHFEWIEPCWLHLDRMGIFPELIADKLAMVADYLAISFDPMPSEDMSLLRRDGASGRPTTSRARAMSLTTAMANWVAAGRPRRSLERIKEIFDTICQPCGHFVSTGNGKGSCGLCTCALRRVDGLLNKISLATEGCPDKPPRWEPEVQKRAESTPVAAE